MSNTRKFYVIGYQDNDLLHTNAQDPTCHYTAPGMLPNGLRKSTGSITGAELVAAGFQLLDNMTGDKHYLTVSRRAAARAIVAYLKRVKYHNHEEFSVIEVGEFNRTTRPVMHWNIVHYSTGKAKGTKGAKFQRIGTAKYGIPLRIDARAEAKRLTEAAKSDGSYYEHKWVAEPVYAGGK
ncbi:hypothetical protein CPT_Ponderosa_011 [Stenotrophomonas phage Ponderosa]|uniref:Uncharacterized protein n=1 Tax=Stenotrophomonas phage Ponderosa TaxID=2591103 RepID=A0A5B9N6R0_9CAUD|nr:hypothetical protein CPT_Ponderosa_011 [Stenotrophomonas phage Ponderosa]